MKLTKRSTKIKGKTHVVDHSGDKLAARSRVNIPTKYQSREEKMAYLVKKINKLPKNQKENLVEETIRKGRLLQFLWELLIESYAGIARIGVRKLAAHCQMNYGAASICLTLARHVDPKKHPALMKIPVFDLLELIRAAKGRKLGPFLREEGLDPKAGAETPKALAKFRLQIKEINSNRCKRPARRTPMDPPRDLCAHLELALQHLNESSRIIKRSGKTDKFWTNIPKEEVREILQAHLTIKATRYEIGQQLKSIKNLLDA